MRDIPICSLELFSCVFIVKSTNDVYNCKSRITLFCFQISMYKFDFSRQLFKNFGTVCTRGGLLKKTAAVYMFSLYPLKLSEGKKRKILKVREELRLGTCQSTFFFCFWRRCRRQLLPRHIMPRRTEVYIFAFCSKISRYYCPQFSFLAFFLC